MPDPAPSHEDLRSARNAARGALEARIAQVKADLAARGVGGRLADKASEEAKAGLAMALDIAKESKGILAGTAAALALWFLRNPILGWLETIMASQHAPETGDSKVSDDD